MAEGKFTDEKVKMTDQQEKSRGARNYAIAFVLAAFVILLWLITWSKLGINIYNRDL